MADEFWRVLPIGVGAVCDPRPSGLRALPAGQLERRQDLLAAGDPRTRGDYPHTKGAAATPLPYMLYVATVLLVRGH